MSNEDISSSSHCIFLKWCNIFFILKEAHEWNMSILVFFAALNLQKWYF